MTPSSNTRLSYRNQEHDDDAMLLTTTAAAAATPGLLREKEPLPQSVDLPRHSKRELPSMEKFLWDVELEVGRVAMIAAILLLATEFVSGTSLADQILGMIFFLQN